MTKDEFRALAASFPEAAAGSHFDVGAKKFGELLERKTGGKLKVAVFPGGQLGQETEVIQNVQTGTIEATFIGHDPLAQFAPVTTILSQPYLFRDHEQAFHLLEGRLGETIEAQLREGVVSQLEVFETERSLLNAQLQLLAVHQQILADTVTLYKALGGGWPDTEVRNTAASQPQ